jgi:hypothetical protein
VVKERQGKDWGLGAVLKNLGQSGGKDLLQLFSATLHSSFSPLKIGGVKVLGICSQRFTRNLTP